METYLPRSDKLKAMVHQGIPHSLRPQLWMRLSGAHRKKATSDLSYKDVVKASSNDHVMTSKQIERVSFLFTYSVYFCSIIQLSAVARLIYQGAAPCHFLEHPVILKCPFKAPCYFKMPLFQSQCHFKMPPFLNIEIIFPKSKQLSQIRESTNFLSIQFRASVFEIILRPLGFFCSQK